MPMAATDDYWNHNTAYHPWLLTLARRDGHALDVGCGDGLLAQRLATVSRAVTALDPDQAAITRARDRIGTGTRVSVQNCSFDDFDSGGDRFDLITFVASLHHMDLCTTLQRARGLLAPGGTIAVVGLSANTSVGDWLISALCLPAVRLGSRWHREHPDIGVVVADPRESLTEIRRVACDVLPGVTIRRALYYRYLLRWTLPD
ncbi:MULTISPECIES: class I SAM-dependent methyltransferase [Mycobacteriaceae]|uniref:SAM-dependent methyltransferase n=1 Tax=Mycolicibacterium neoaurum VKM Ac-1815D TaxID=700508 RepID=V5XG46_MYCNE|nr:MULTISPECIES: class I SAM-dependent methyltransferase [Mycobacteriaceae]AHC26641.1 SAM-dependent methyltransferase [Mycolicibacterium neoaurum VKM Ac-1815D]AMO06963.1 SAM-dependent methyltransferase [Mycolicibacterium neoaurum]AXK74669.1 class I SAM-dependent methyltransferase [Mycolicibacterium neoaurum]KJQ48141.1 SAM-dependent methyltransferase [Mycolicibacterium neoaurum]KUM06178.1 SAM-dependent methyltransferase [Mycolicibacterium neoaurum]